MNPMASPAALWPNSGLFKAHGTLKSRADTSIEGMCGDRLDELQMAPLRIGLRMYQDERFPYTGRNTGHHGNRDGRKGVFIIENGPTNCASHSQNKEQNEP